MANSSSMRQPGGSAASRKTGPEHVRNGQIRSEATGLCRSNSGDLANGCRRVMLLDKWVQMQPPFESWSLSSPPVPPRSQLYSLEPIGVGTAHGREPDRLRRPARRSAFGKRRRPCGPGALSVWRIPRTRSSRRRPKLSESAGMDSGLAAMRSTALRTAPRSGSHALEAATTRRDLRCLTLLPFRYALPDHLFRRHRAWCALCFDQWRANGQMVYEPLLWAIEVSSHCPVHARPLDCICRHCARMLSPLGVFSRPGYCERCDGWLGAPDADSNRARPGSPMRKRRDVVVHSGGRFAGDASSDRPAGCPGIVSPEPGCLSRSGRRWQCPCLGTAYSVPT